MTEQKTERNHTVRNAGILVTGALALTLAGAGLGGALRGSDARTSYTPASATPELATPSTSAAAGSANPEASASVAPSLSPEINIQNFTVEKLGTFEVQIGDIIAGDISMSDTKDSAIFPLYDQDTHKAADVTDNTKTALYVEVQAPGFIHAEWGATVTRGLTPEKKAEMLKLQAISKQRAGFQKVDVVIWTGFNSTTDEAGYKADNAQSVVTPANPSSSPEATPGTNPNGLSKQDLINVVITEIQKGNLTPDQEYKLMQQLISCLCACSNPEAPKPIASATPEACTIPSFKDHVMKAGETFTVPAGVDFIAQGDVVIDGKKTYDSSEKTGAISVVTDQKTNTIKAPWGADIQVFDCTTDTFIKNTYANDVEQLKATGKSVDKNSINQLK